MCALVRTCSFFLSFRFSGASAVLAYVQLALIKNERHFFSYYVNAGLLRRGKRYCFISGCYLAGLLYESSVCRNGNRNRRAISSRETRGELRAQKRDKRHLKYHL